MCQCWGPQAKFLSGQCEEFPTLQGRGKVCMPAHSLMFPEGSHIWLIFIVCESVNKATCARVSQVSFLLFLVSVRAKLLSRVRLFATLWIVAHQAPLFMGFSRQEYWSGLLCPPRGDLLTASLMSPALADRFFTPSTTWEAQLFLSSSQNTVLC